MKYMKYMNKKQIEDWLFSMNIENYVINDDLSVDVNGNAIISNKQLTKIPVKFGSVSGGFYCVFTKLTSLENCPTSVGESFSCAYNNLTTLEHCPTSVGEGFYCHNNNLTSLEHCPTLVSWGFNCGNNKLTSLEHCPTSVGGGFYCNNNQLTILEHCPTSVGGNFNAGNIKVPCSPAVSKWLITKDKYLFHIIDNPSPDMVSLYQMLWEI